MVVAIMSVDMVVGGVGWVGDGGGDGKVAAAVVVVVGRGVGRQ